MPRPGPRPYECVRRAWHSEERHRPMRGSIIQKIFRCVHERHSTVTKKKSEWQIKVPTVVFKAEEIMYSKANSEAEYMDPETLWDRANDAIDVIIRRDESTETGPLLPPCVEAALLLGCVAERTSRSERNSKPRNYLPASTQEFHAVSPKVSNQRTNDHNSNSLSPSSASRHTFGRPALKNLVTLASESNKPGLPKTLTMGAVYPLYEGTDFPPRASPSGFNGPQTPQSNMICHRPIYPEVDHFQSFPSKPVGNGAQNEKTVLRGAPQEECDLSLRLGQSLDCGLHLGNTSVGPTDDPNERGKSKVISAANEREFCFFRAESTKEPSRFSMSCWDPEVEGRDLGLISRKRKEAPTSSHFTGQLKRPGL
ncbi:unnamed protein product [Cuscuta epithymum]|uniref:Histone acetyltransferase n=1 Tax=Cuscuta epithymum TaxID=186058 RepID=A0AAV0FKJ9_9ASTE|nr:unnamed protein product [Cuscuta epithymum]